MLSLSKNAVLGGVLGDLTRRSRSVEEGRSCRQARPLGRFRATFACNLAAPSTLDPAETRGQTTRPEFYTIILTGGDAVCQRISGTGNANPNLRRSHPGQALLTSRTGNAHIQDRRCQTQIDCNACPRNAPSAMPVPGMPRNARALAQCLSREFGGLHCLSSQFWKQNRLDGIGNGQ